MELNRPLFLRRSFVTESISEFKPRTSHASIPLPLPKPRGSMPSKRTFSQHRPIHPTTLLILPPGRVHKCIMNRSFPSNRRGSNLSTSKAHAPASNPTFPPSSIRTVVASKGPLISLRNSLTSRFESLFTTSDQTSKRKIEAIVQHIAHYRRHHETKIFERGTSDASLLTDYHKFRKRCIILMEYTTEFVTSSFLAVLANPIRSLKGLSSHLQDYASNEVIKLAISDHTSAHFLENVILWETFPWTN